MSLLWVESASFLSMNMRRSHSAIAGEPADRMHISKSPVLEAMRNPWSLLIAGEDSLLSSPTPELAVSSPPRICLSATRRPGQQY